MDRQNFITVFLLFIHVLRQGIVLVNGVYGVEWMPPSWKGLPLYCPVGCYSEELCCNCHSKSIFDFESNPCRANITALGELVDNSCNGSTVLEHTLSRLYNFPENICDIPGLTKIILSKNFILDIPNLSCLSNLTYLDLSNNNIATLRQASLVENRNLKFVDLSFNSITHIEAGVLESLSFFTMNLRSNSITTLDVTDLMITRSFCKVDVSNNSISSIVNNKNWAVNLSHYYGPGVYNGTYNQLKYIPDWNKIGFSTLTFLGKMLYRSYDARHNPISCDCNMAQALAFFKPILLAIDREFFDVKCDSPKALTGQALRNFVEENNIKQLVCNFTGVAICPSHCTCVTEPRYSNEVHGTVILVTIITCKNSSLNRLPHILPESDEIEFYFTGSGIKELMNEHYLSRVSVLKLVSIPHFENKAFGKLKRLKKFSLPRKAQLNGIPKELSSLHPCVFLQDGDFVMNCSCSLHWMSDWLLLAESGDCQRDYEFKCLTTNDTKPARSYLQSMNCDALTSGPMYVTLASMYFALLIILLFLTTAWKRKSEIRMLIRETKLGKLFRPRVSLDQDRIVFISFDGSNQCIHTFILKRLEPFLITKGFHVFIPPRDLALGGVRSEEAAWQISASRYYIAFLSLSYLEEDMFETQNEWRCIWNGYLSDNRKELLVLNYDLLKPSDVPCSKMKTVIRVGNVVDFDVGENTILSKIVKLFDSSTF